LAQARGLTPSAELLALDAHPASIEEAEGCSIAPGSTVVTLERIRKLDAIPVAVSHSLVPLACARRCSTSTGRRVRSTASSHAPATGRCAPPLPDSEQRVRDVTGLAAEHGPSPLWSRIRANGRAIS
jgi:DNA-binding GntR family transcriptional regulator